MSTTPTAAARPSWWQWPTILSLDAPAVVLVWQLLIARSAAIPLGAAHALVLTMSVWLAYVADRWIEGWRLMPAQVRTRRHYFYQRWRVPVALLWLLIFAADVTVAIVRLTTREMLFGLALVGPVALYLLSHQLVHRHRRWRVPKEICVAGLLCAGVAVFPIAIRPSADLVAPLLLLGLLCFSNTALISTWELHVDAAHGQTSFARTFPGGAAISRWLPWAIAAGAGLVALQSIDASRAPAICAMASGVLLGLVDRLEPRAGWELARVLSDAALLTPLIAFGAWS